MDTQIHYILNLDLYKPALWEQLILAFRPLKKIEGPTVTVWYKHFSDRLYIYRRDFKQPEQVAAPFNGGFYAPWTN